MKHLLFLYLLLICSLIRAQESGTELVVQSGHSQKAYAISSPNGKYFLSYSDDGSLKLWDTEGNVLRKYSGHGDHVNGVNFFPDGTTFASISSDRTIRVWDILTGLKLTIKDIVAVQSYNILTLSADGNIIMSKRYYDSDALTNLWTKDGTFLGSRDTDLPPTFDPGYINAKFKLYDQIGITAVKYSYDGKFFATGSEDKNIRIWSGEGALIRTFPTQFDDHISDLGFSPDGKMIVVCGLYNKDLFLYTVNGELIKKLNGHTSYNYGVGFLPDGRIYSSSHDGSVALWDTSGTQLKLNLLYIDGGGICSAFSKDGNYIVTGYGGTQKDKQVVFLVSTENLSAIKIGNTNGERVNEITVNGDGSLIATVSLENNKVTIWGKTGMIKKLDGHSSSFGTYGNTIKFSPDDQYIAVGFKDNTISLWTSDGHFVKDLIAHTSEIEKIDFSPDSKFLVSASDDGETIIWNIETGKHISLITKGAEWLMFTPDGLFDASRNGGRLVSIVNGFEAFGLDQFAIKKNRPDLILSSMGLGNQKLIDHYYNRYLLRLKKTGFTEQQLSEELHVPVTILKTKLQTDKFIDLQFEMSDSKYLLKTYQIFVNDVPIFGATGKPITGNLLDKTEKIELTEGENKIEISCINEKGVESIRALVKTKYETATKRNLYFVAFGVSTYKNPQLNLQFAHKDALDLEQTFKQMKGKGFENIFTKVLVNEQVTPVNIKAAKAFVANAKPDDVFVLYIAGHGMHDKDAQATYYFLTYNTNLNNLTATAANFEFIEDLLQGIPPRNKLFLMDACESGEIDDDVQTNFVAQAGSRGMKSRGMKITQAPSTVNNQQSTKRTYLYQKDRYIYNDLARRSGAIVFSSSKGGEFSYERSDIQNGLFTKSIITALTSNVADKNSDGLVSTDELRDYVSADVATSSSDLQHPTVDRDNIYQKFGFQIK